MGILFGILKERGAIVSDRELQSLSFGTERYSTGEGVFSTSGRLGMGFQPYVSHDRSKMESGLCVDIYKNVVSFDGRLDNYRELADMLGLNGIESSDSVIVLAAFQWWGEECFSRFTGDWAVALWHALEQRLFLARDHAGTRSLYFGRTGRHFQWATYLDSFSAFEADLCLSTEYAAAYLSCSPVSDLTPYETIRSVLPGHYVILGRESIVQRPHWSPVIRDSICYQTESEYDEHFLSLFRQAVLRRTGPGQPVLAQLSGGMDSTSIVCMSDLIRRSADSDADILDTISFFDDAEDSLDERPYFAVTESRRGKVGIHVKVTSSNRSFRPPIFDARIYQVPGCDSFSIELEQSLSHSVWEKGYRSILSGVGGDEVLGGIPNGLPELADYLVSGKLVPFVRQAVAWSLPDRSPLIQTMSRTARYVMGLYMQSNPKSRPNPPWMSKDMRDIYTNNLLAMDMVPKRFGIPPHRLENAFTWWQVMETLPHLSPQIVFRPEYRYPMLDKDLVQYLFSVPPDQLVRPGRRRSMMRRALRDIVPTEILERRRKAFQLHGPMSAIRAAHTEIEGLLSTSSIAEMGLIDVDALRCALRSTAAGSAEWYQAILRAIAYELWLNSRASRSAITSNAQELQQTYFNLAMPQRPSSSA
jgi:asparagine synthase (glutamine-hydrolysing)